MSNYYYYLLLLMEGVLQRKLEALPTPGMSLGVFLNRSKADFDDELAKTEDCYPMRLKNYSSCAWNAEAIVKTVTRMLNDYQYRPGEIWHALVKVDKVLSGDAYVVLYGARFVG